MKQLFAAMNELFGAMAGSFAAMAQQFAGVATVNKQAYWFIEFAPTQINVKNTPYEGQAEARWTRVPNAQLYEAKAFNSTAGDSPENIPWDTLPVIPVRPVSLIFRDQPIGSYLTVRVRAIGSKGPSPWTETATVRVY